MVMDFKFKSNASIVNAKMSNMVAKQMPFAISLALNNTAKTMIAKNKQDMNKIFSRPVAFTRNAFFYKPARKGDTSVMLRRKDMQRGKHYLEVQQDGGARPQTGIEKAFQYRLPYAGVFKHMTPTSNFPRIKSGVISPGERNKIMAAMQVQQDPAANSPKRGRPKRGKDVYFAPKSFGRKAGIYKRKEGSRSIQKMFNFIDRNITYRPRLRFDDRMALYGRTIYPKRLQSAMKRALATAKIR